MKNKILYCILFTSLFVALLTACVPGFLRPQESAGSAAATAAVQTLDALQTEVWVGTLQAELTRVAVEQGGAGGEEQISTATAQAPADIPTSTSTPLPVVNTPVPPSPTVRIVPTEVPTPCYWAQFIKDVTIPDESEIDPGQYFTKTWRLKNIGTCSWNTGFDIVFVSGNALGADAAVDFPQNVQPGETVDISVDMRAPTDEGDYKGNWKLRSDTGVVFGLGSNQSLPFWASIVVPEDVVEINPNKPINFAESYKSATWRSSGDSVSSTDDYTNGSVYTTKKPDMEKDRVDDELALIMIPGSGDDGYIYGRYPAVNIEDGDRLTAVIGCTSNKPKCNVTFKIDYRIGDGATQNLGEWDEVYEGLWTTLDIDLSEFDGESVRFFLRVENNGSSKDDRVFWLMPRIRR
jgi:hypothetical protein